MRLVTPVLPQTARAVSDDSKRANLFGKWWRGTESNCRHYDFQSYALPTELPRPEVERQLYRSLRSQRKHWIDANGAERGQHGGGERNDGEERGDRCKGRGVGRADVEQQ